MNATQSVTGRTPWTGCRRICRTGTRRWKLAVLIPFFVLTALTAAQDFEITRSTIDGGGAMNSSGGEFELSGTIGQADAGVMEGGGFTLTGGFWFETPPGDCNETGFVDIFDHTDMVEEPDPCLSGPDGLLPVECRCHDIDRDSDVDLSDVALFQSSFVDG